MNDDQTPKQLVWIGSSRKEMMAVPRVVQRTFGYGLYLAQLGDKHPDAKPLKGFHGANTLEIVEDHRGDTYKAIKECIRLDTRSIKTGKNAFRQ
jgi:phage-related protein